MTSTPDTSTDSRAGNRRVRPRDVADGAPRRRRTVRSGAVTATSAARPAHPPARERRLVRTTAATALGVLAVAVLSVAALASAGSADEPQPPTPAGTYRLPLAGPADVARGFEPPPQPWAAGHRGVDLRSAPGSPAVSPVAGVVTFAGPVAGRGVVTVTDGNGRRSSVEPVLASVRTGDVVGAGQVLGVVLAEGSHCAPATCLHWGVRVSDVYVDPLALLPGAGPVVLLPLDDAGPTRVPR